MRGMFGIAVLLLLYLENTKLKFSEIIFFYSFDYFFNSGDIISEE